MNHRVARLVVTTVMTAAVLVLFADGRGYGAQPNDSPCPKQPNPPTIAAGATEQAQLSGPSDEQVIDLGHDNNFNDLIVEMAVTHGTLPAGPLDFEPGEFKSGKAHIPAADISVTVQRRRPDSVDLRLCIDPRVSTHHISAGDYTGSIQITDPRLSGSDVAIKATVQLRAIVLLGWLAVPIATLIGLLGVWATEQRAQSKSLFSRSIVKWFATNGWWSGILGGIAAFALFEKALANPGFGNAGMDVVILIFGMIGAAYTIGSGTSAAKGRDPEPAAGPSPSP